MCLTQVCIHRYLDIDFFPDVKKKLYVIHNFQRDILIAGYLFFIIKKCYGVNMIDNSFLSWDESFCIEKLNLFCCINKCILLLIIIMLILYCMKNVFLKKVSSVRHE